MSLLQRIGLRRGSLIIILSIVFGLTIIYLYHTFYSRVPEIALVIGEPYEEMRQRSSAIIDPHLSGRIWHNVPKTDAHLRFIDPKYGFITPAARFLAVSFNEKGIIYSVRMSPQIEPLLYDDAIKIVLDLQEQWRKAGWIPKSSPLANTPELRAQLHSLKCSETTNWRAGDQYRVMLNLGCFNDKKHPDEERYMITMEIAKAR
jgi:hypothetical protein